jgi:DNA helicase II / ATP-dependent DNA helicase PcrA
MADYAPTPEQEAVLAHQPDRHGRLLAGPGTGKSATVVALIVGLLALDRQPRIRLLTFTRAATAELARKVADHPEAAVERPSTIHSFAISALLRNPGCADFPDPLRIADDWEMANLVQPQLAAMIGVTPTFVRRRLIPEMAANWESLAEHPDPEVDEHTRNRFLGAWDEHRRVYGYTLLPELPDLLRRAVEAHDDLQGLDYDLLVVDEYQDLNACDLKVLRLLADRGTAVLGVGDDEQSIYGFRKAAPEGIRRFPQDYPGCEDHSLTTTHRCGSEIIRWARHVIEADPGRDRGRARLRAAPEAPAGETALLGFRSNGREAQGVADLVEHLVRYEGVDPTEILVLFGGDHNGVFSRPIKQRLEEAGIPVFDPSWVDEILDAPHNRAAILMLRLLSNRHDSLAWAGLLKLEGGIGDAFLQSIYERAAERRGIFARALLEAHEEGFPNAPAASRHRGSHLVARTLEWLGQQAPPEEIEDGRWGSWITETFRADPALPLSEELAELLLGVDDAMEEALALGRYLGLVHPLAKDRAQARGPGVRFMSMTMSKGLTVTAAIVAAAEDGVIPRPDAEIAEERRLLYVAMTRARLFQYVTWAARRTGPTACAGAPRVGQRRNVSRFLRTGPVASQDGEAYIRERWAQIPRAERAEADRTSASAA